MKKSKISEFLDELFADDYRGGEGWGYAVPKHLFSLAFLQFAICVFILWLAGL